MFVFATRLVILRATSRCICLESDQLMLLDVICNNLLGFWIVTFGIRRLKSQRIFLYTGKPSPPPPYTVTGLALFDCLIFTVLYRYGMGQIHIDRKFLLSDT